MARRDRLPREDVVSAIAEFIDSGLGADLCPGLNADTLLVGEILDLPALLRLIGYLEEQYQFTLAPNDLRRENFATPGRIAAYVGRARSRRATLDRPAADGSPDRRQSAA